MKKVSKRSKQADQRDISLVEFKSTKKLPQAVRRLVKENDPVQIEKSIRRDLRWTFGPRLVNRIAYRARVMHKTFLGVLRHFSEKA